jgi:hypothetical protein
MRGLAVCAAELAGSRRIVAGICIVSPALARAERLVSRKAPPAAELMNVAPVLTATTRALAADSTEFSVDNSVDMLCMKMLVNFQSKKF